MLFLQYLYFSVLQEIYSKIKEKEVIYVHTYKHEEHRECEFCETR